MNFAALKSRLSSLAPLVSAKSPIPALSCVKLVSKDGFLSIEAASIEQAMRITMPCDGPALSCCVGLRRLLSVPGDGDVEIKQAAGKILLKGPGFSASLETLSTDEFPASIEMSGREFALEANFHESLKWVAKAAAGSDDSRHVLRGVRFSANGMTASDGRRLHRAAFPDLGGVTIPDDCAAMLAPLLGAGAKLHLNGSQLVAEHGDTVFSTKLVDADFPDKLARQILDRNGKGSPWGIEPEKLGKLAASLPQSASAPWIDFAAADKVLAVSARDGENVVEVTIPCDASGRFRCGRGYVIDMLSGFSGEQRLLVDEDANEIRIVTPDRAAVLMGMRR